MCKYYRQCITILHFLGWTFFVQLGNIQRHFLVLKIKRYLLNCDCL